MFINSYCRRICFMAEEEKYEKYVTKYELLQTQQHIEDKLYTKINNVDEKVDTLNDIVLPLVESSKQTADNTKQIATSLTEFTQEQRRTNGKFYDRLHEQELSINELGQKTKSQTEEKKANATVTVAVIGAVGIVISGIFSLAPYIFN